MYKWFLRNKSDKVEGTPLPAATGLTPAPRVVSEDSVSTILHARRMNSWLDEAYSDCEKSGGFECLEGKGKPVVIPDGDALNSILKNASYLPSWLELQHEIRDDIRALLNKVEGVQLPPIAKADLEAINKKIARYNASVPTPILQKGKLHFDSVREQAQKWE